MISGTSTIQKAETAAEMMAHGHPHPFEIIKSVVPEENWLSFLKEARSCGQNFYDDSVAYMWAKQVFIESHEGRKKGL